MVSRGSRSPRSRAKGLTDQQGQSTKPSSPTKRVTTEKPEWTPQQALSAPSMGLSCNNTTRHLGQSKCASKPDLKERAFEEPPESSSLCRWHAQSGPGIDIHEVQDFGQSTCASKPDLKERAFEKPPESSSLCRWHAQSRPGIDIHEVVASGYSCC
jgi:hypothetical protein